MLQQWMKTITPEERFKADELARQKNKPISSSVNFNKHKPKPRTTPNPNHKKKKGRPKKEKRARPLDIVLYETKAMKYVIVK